MRENYGRWPWRRSLYALLLSYLHEANARAIGIDVTFAGADAHEGDDELFAHYLGQKANTVLALSFTDSPGQWSPMTRICSRTSGAWKTTPAVPTASTLGWILPSAN